MDQPNRSQQPHSGPFRVLANDEAVHALWPDDLPVPAGWRTVAGPAPEQQCLRSVAELWTDLRPAGRRAGGVTVHGLLRRQAARTPDAPAVVAEDERLSYRELDRRSDRLAHALRDGGITADTVVPVCLERSADMVTALVAVLKAGGAFLPLDPAHPSHRLRRLVSDAGATLAVTSTEHRGRLGLPAVLASDYRGPGGSVSAPADTTVPDDLAYVVYTSGTTGTPKGVPVSHRTMALTVSRAAEAYGLSHRDRVLQLGALGFDTSLEQIFAPLLSGSTLVLGGRLTWAPIELASRILELGITVADLTPAYWHRFLDLMTEGARPPASLRLMIVGGDTVHAEDCRTSLHRLPATQLLNAYGLTEAGITSTICEILPGMLASPAHAPVPVGRPLLGTFVHVLDPTLRPVPPGRRGEVFLGGQGLARGYWRQPELTAERFLPEPYAGDAGTRMYRTGDSARWRPDGNLELLGRTDDQVKVRGFRVDPAEVEAHLAEHPAVGLVTVLAPEHNSGARALTAYYTRGDGTGPDFREFLADRLPDYLVPTAYVPVERMPLTPNGKIDRRELADTGPAMAGAGRPGQRGAGGNGGRSREQAAEHGLAYLWAQLLDVDTVAMEDDFFELGGNSLLAMEMLARARIMFGIGVDRIRDLTRALLTDPTLGAFTTALHAAGRGPAETLAGQRIDFTGEAELGFPVRRSGERAARPEQPAEILLTGATGFCGAHLLHTLLTTTDAQVHCLVRAPDQEHALERIRAAHQRFLRRDLDPARVRPLVGDLAEPLLGLSRTRFEQLAGTVDAVHHLGGQVNFLYPYHQLRAANVAGTREVIRLAGHSRAVPVHYLSTMAVLAGFGAAGVPEVSEDTPLDHPEHLSVGYVESKWVAEALLHNAAAAGLPVSVYRVNDVTGDLATGTMNLGTELCALIKYFTDSGEVPEVELQLDFVPADSFTRALAHLAGNTPATGQVYHLTNPNPAMLPVLAERLRSRGRRVEVLPYHRWVRGLVSYAATHPEHPITPFVPLFVDRGEGTAMSISEMYFRPTFPLFSRDRAAQELNGSGIEIPPVDDHLLDFYLDRLEATGYLERVA
ncbi:amino acid adenylation domain-containing protein [Kitasatospora sp. MBT63]|uniref:amino acid adenylation domain-containing protein n=1 Tax=Kitasatospora sp. MBT63 TaxID=1444768 RepID=UPI00068D50E6|nr:amino acid adenylation domain-containing protein [Kitasatospora sp. MBT63]